jgi:hypothetical protein
MSDYGQTQETHEQTFDLEDIDEREPGEIPENVEPNNSTQPTQRSSTQSANANVQPAIFIGHTARRLRLEKLVSDYRGGRKTKDETLTDINIELDKGPALSAEEKAATLRLCIEEINSAETRAKRGLTTEGQPASRGRGTPRDRTPSNATQPSKQARLFDQVSRLSDDESERDEEPKKRLRLDESEMPWFERDDLNEPRINPSCVKTIKTLRLFNRDIKGSKFLVSIATGAPDNVPSSQWERIFKGESVDLDQILSSLYRITITEERKARLGDADILLGPTEATRKVTTSSDWSSAWRRAARAIAFAFPHRTRELENYAEYIENEFAAKVASGHHRIILFDVAVRNLVRGGQQILLTDYNKFSSLYSAIVMPDGVQYASGGRKAQTTRGKTEICNRFNDKGCSGTGCRYRHVCKTCGASNHGKSTCGTTQKN